MSAARVFPSHEFMMPADGEPIRSVVTSSAHATVVAWHVAPGQTIFPHVHPAGQDTWIILTGCGEYRLDADGRTVPVVAGDVVVAPAGAVHGVHNQGPEPLRFISVVAPADAGYEPL